MPAQQAGDTPLIHAVRHGHVGVVAAMLAEGDYDVNETLRNGLAATPLLVGQRFKHADRFLLEVWETYVVPHDIASEMWR